jgi:hypothetical protein
MACGCDGAPKQPGRGPGCGCEGGSTVGVAGRSKSATRSERASSRAATAAGIPSPTRSERGATHAVDAFEASSAPRQAEDRVAPIGTRPTVPVRDPFEVRFRPAEANSIPGLIYDCFSGLGGPLQHLVIDLLKRLPAEVFPRLRDYLLRFTDVPMRLDVLQRVVDANGHVPDLPDPSPADDPATPSVHYLAAGDQPVYFVPAPPAPQRVCLTNGFDPRWGTPPATYQGVALAFEPNTGSYAFDRAYALANSPKDSARRPLYDTFAFDQVERGYGSNLVLAPWKPTLSSPWTFRWQARVAPPRIVCETG